MDSAAETQAPPRSFRIEDDELPELPAVARNLMRLLRDPDLTNGQFGKHLESEDATGLVRQIVEIANSAFYCSRVPIRTLSDAISRIGRRQLYDVVMMAAVGTLYASTHNALRAHRDHSIASGVIG